MEKILFVEILTHAPLINTEQMVFEVSSTWEPLFILSSRVARDLSQDLNSVNTVVLEKSEDLSNYQLIQSAANELRKIVYSYHPKIIVLNTLNPKVINLFSNLVKELKTTEHIKLCCVIHNSHHWDFSKFMYIMSESMVLTGFLGKIRGLKNRVADIWSKRKIVDLIDGTIRLDSLISIPKSLSNKLNVVLPWKLDTDSSDIFRIPSNEKIFFVIPGRVERIRRDYLSVFKAFKTLFRDHSGIASKVQLILLGKLIDTEIITFMHSNGLESNVLYFEDYLSERKYREILMNSHYVILPTRKFSPYGRFKLTAGMHDSIIARIPILIPDHFAKANELPECCIRYKQDCLAELLYSLIVEILDRSDSYQQKKRNVNDCKNRIFNLQNVAQSLELFLEELINVEND